MARAQKERDEMIEAKKRELNQQLAELDDGSDEQSSTFEGNYYSNNILTVRL